MEENKHQEALNSFSKLLTIMDELREKCPWDRKQTNLSLKSNTIEEVYELAQAIEDNDYQEIKKELGDLLLHVVFYSKIGSESGEFDIKAVIDSLCEKLIRRHPHIYGEVKVENAEDVKKTWEQIKMTEGRTSVFSGVPRALDSLIKACRLQEKAAGVGFDWENKEQVWEKVKEELQKAGIRVEVDSRDEKIGYKIREAQLQKLPYMLVVGDKEIEKGAVGVRSRKDGDIGEQKLEEFICKIKEEIENYVR